MRALVYLGPERMRVEDVPTPRPAAGEALLEVGAAGICGSDIHGFLGHSERRRPGLVMGHETVARIADLGASASGWRPGQRVCFNPLLSCRSCPACLAGRQNVCPDWRIFGMDRLHGTYAEFVSVPTCQLYVLPESLPEAEAILAEPMAVVIHAFRISMLEVPRTMVIVGGGPIGCLALLLAKNRGVQRVGVIDVNDDRLAAARTLGAEVVVHAGREDVPEVLRAWTDGRGAEHVVEAVGTDATRRAAVAACAKGGRLLFLGLAENDTALPWIEMTRNEQSVFTSFAYAPRDFEASVRLLETRPFDLKPWTEAMPLAEGEAAFRKMAHDPGSTLKLMLAVSARATTGGPA
jgi:threonine dehydrogenase-like Zn-dependent dehydrogenase